MNRRFVGIFLVLTSVNCGGSGPTSPTPTPAAPTPAAPQAPIGLSVVSEQSEIGGTEFQLSWGGTATLWELSIGTTPGSSDVMKTEVATSGFQWRPDRAGTHTFYARVIASNSVGASAPSAELRLVSIDLRDVIDALLFSTGPLSDTPARAPSAATAWYPWRDGTRVRILMSSETSDGPRQSAQRFLEEYAEFTDNAVTGAIEITQDPMHQWPVQQVPLNTVAVRVVVNPQGVGLCTLSAPGDGCNTGGPPSTGTFGGRAITTLGTPDADYIAHELGHAYGMWHVRIPAGSKVQAMMGSRSLGLSETERRAISRVRAAGLRNGSRRSQALALGLVNP